MIKAQNIYKSYGKLKIIKGININIKKGEIVTITGESGAGKSTLLYILGTLDRPDNNEYYKTSITIDKVSILELRDKQLSKFRNQNIGFIFQSNQLLPEFTVLQNILIPTMIAKKKIHEEINHVKELLKMMNILYTINKKPNELSGGELQRVAVARALINKPKIIFADEPSGSLDSINSKKLHEIFLRLRIKFNQTFLIVTHSTKLAKMSDRILTMKDGKFV